MSTSRFGFCIGLALTTALAACATRPDPSVTSAPGTDQAAPASNVVMVTVNHTDMNRQELTVYVEPVGGVRTQIGRLEAGEMKTFPYQVTASRNLKLIGISPSGSQLTTSSLNVPEGAGLQWEVGINSLRIRR